MAPTTDKKRAVLLCSTRHKWFVQSTWEEILRDRPYMIYAIFYNLQKHFGWDVLRMDFFDGLNPWSFCRRIRRFAPSIIYTYGSFDSLHPIVLRRLIGGDYKVVHGWDDVYGDIWRDNYGSIMGRFMDWFEKQIIMRSDEVITLSDHNLVRGRDWGRECIYIPNGCDHIQPDHSKCSIRLAGDLKLVYTGDQARWKRTAEICRAMRHVPSNIKLYLTGRQYPYLQQYASDNCIFLGFVSKNNQWCVMDQADVLVCTADQDCNAKFHEYLRMKKPILGYDGKANLLFKNGHNAILTRDYPSAIMRLYRDPDLRRQLAENAARDIPVHTWKEIAGMFDNQFHCLVS